MAQTPAILVCFGLYIVTKRPQLRAADGERPLAMSSGYRANFECLICSRVLARPSRSGTLKMAMPIQSVRLQFGRASTIPNR